MSNQTFQTALTIVFILGGVTLMVCYTLALIHMQRGTKFKFFMLIISLLIAAALSGMLMQVANTMLVRQDINDFSFWLALTSFTNFIFLGCFGGAHWLFAFEYFSIAKGMPLALKGIKIPEEQRQKYRIVSAGVFILNATLAFFNAILEFLAGIRIAIKGESADTILWLQFGTTLGCTFVELAACTLVLYALYIIR